VSVPSAQGKACRQGQDIAQARFGGLFLWRLHRLAFLNVVLNANLLLTAERKTA